MDDNMLLGKDNELSEEMNRTDYIYMVSRRNLIISLNAELDHHLADEMREVIDEIIDERGVNRVIIDFSKVGFMDSAGIGLIMGRYKKVMFIGGKAAVTNVGNAVDRIFKISRGYFLYLDFTRLYTYMIIFMMRLKRKTGGMYRMLENNVEVIFDAKSENESFARVVAAAFVTKLDPTLEEISDIKTAVSEAVTNCIVHGYEGEEGKVYMDLSLKDNEVTIKIKDDGVGIDNIHRAMEPLFTTKPELERSGMGFSFMEAFMDELEVHSRKQKGTTVIMKKKIGDSNR